MPNTTKAPKSPKDRLASKKANVLRVWIAMDADVAAAFEEAKTDLDLVKIIAAGDGNHENSARLAAAQETFSKAEAALKEEAVCFVFRGIGRKKYDRLVGEHRPSEKTKARVEELGGDPRLVSYEPDTFGPVIVSASLVEPELTEEEVRALFEDPNWNGSELNALMSAAIDVNTEHRVVELGKG